MFFGENTYVLKIARGVKGYTQVVQPLSVFTDLPITRRYRIYASAAGSGQSGEYSKNGGGNRPKREGRR